VDDFGTCYSSLSYLQRFRYGELKSDRAGVRGLALDDARASGESILRLASRLGSGGVAGGVETADQLARRRALGCPHGQGYWFAKPLDVPAVEALLRSGANLPN
jgi:EAL domain-containing protein (putative c-di-GMP-specific phosphodiesterase class I)